MNKLAYLLLGGLLAVFIGLLVLCDGEKVTEAAPLAVATAPADSAVTVEAPFGIALDSLQVRHGEIGRNQFLADILLKYHVTYPEIEALVRKADTIFDVRHIRHGKPYSVFCTTDSLEKAKCFVYEPNQVDYIVFDLRDSLHVYRGRREVTTEVREASGVIRSSMFETLAEQGLPVQLALELANMYAWSIDFYRIQKGDYFKVLYEEKLVEGESIGVGRVEAALFNHQSEDHYAFYFENTDGADYFDEQGQSLRKAFLQSPLKYGRLTSGYTRRRFHPVQKRWKAHLGTDYAAPKGTPILAVGDGTVTEARHKKYNGKYVKIRHNSTYTTQYLHMSRINVKQGQRVRQGDVIGFVGSTGLATGPHVCFRFWKHGKQVDHRREKIPPSKPIDPALNGEYEAFITVQKGKLDAVSLPASAPAPAYSASVDR